MVRVKRAIPSWLATLAEYAPLCASILSLPATLYDIPALSQNWYALNGMMQPDPRASLVLSAVSLALSVIANALLVIRFTVHAPKTWRQAVLVSTACWVVKTAIGIANLVVFGALRRNGPGYTYSEGYYCCILSVILSGIVTSLLLTHFFLRQRDKPESEIHFEGRRLVVAEISVFALIALEALIFSKIEGWTFLVGLYFTVVSMLTIGFGSQTPTKTSTKVLLFPFEILAIALLSNQVSIIVEIVSRRKDARREEFYRKSSKYIEEFFGQSDHQPTHANEDDDNLTRLIWRTPKPKKHKIRNDSTNNDRANKSARKEPLTLQQEISRLQRLAREHESIGQLIDLAYSLAALVIFWTISAIIYHFMEGWSYGNAFYFSYIFFLSVGYGDFSPSTPAGQTVFVIWALIAVPIMTNFVVVTIQTMVEKLSKVLSRFAKEKREEREQIADKYFESHDSYLMLSDEGSIFPESLKRRFSTGKDDHPSRRSNDDLSRHSEEEESADAASQDLENAQSTTSAAKEQMQNSSKVRSDSLRGERNYKQGSDEGQSTQSTTLDASDIPDKAALRETLSLAMYLEAQARVILIHALPMGSPARLLLQADANVQQARLTALQHKRPPWYEDLQRSIEKDDRLDKIKRYRQTYAKFLVKSSQLLDLQGDDRLAWEKRLPESEEEAESHA